MENSARPGLTFSFHSMTHFSIQGTRFLATNSRMKAPICCISSEANLSVAPVFSVGDGGGSSVDLCANGGALRSWGMGEAG